jgi:choline transport protein
MTTYTISIGCVALKRLRGQSLPPARWSLGRFGLPINLIAVVYSSFAIVFICFPVATPVESASMNWAIVMFTAVLAVALIYYFKYARMVYVGPVVHVKEVDRSS